MRGTWLAFLIVMGVVSSMSPRAESVEATETGAGEAANFESLLRAAGPMADLGTLLAPLSGTCDGGDGDKRELDRVRCRSTRAYLRKAIPRRSFWAMGEDPAVISVSEFDAAIKGYHLSIAGCLACTRPITVGRTKEQRLITLKVPTKAAESLRAAVEVSRNSVGFDSLSEAKAWLEQSRPALRTQFVFRAAETEWTFGASRGYAMTLLGLRVFNRCTGEILISRPPSASVVDVATLEDGCRQRGASAASSPAPAADANVPAQLSKNDISTAMNEIRPQVFACFEKFKVPGLAQFDFVVAGNGTVNGVRLSGAFFGTPTGTCLLDAAKNARFPRFAKERQQFVYPFFLRL
ncbi:MAG: hypothetical protein H7X95_06550 [Deltaproteobacteria bacterium]|nr:hypothetical protein [Deltaproteobacteria bacterium]